MSKHIVSHICAVNCAVDIFGFCLNIIGKSVSLKAVQRSVGSTTPNLTTNLTEAGRWLKLNLLHIIISINLYPLLHTLLPCLHSGLSTVMPAHTAQKP